MIEQYLFQSRGKVRSPETWTIGMVYCTLRSGQHPPSLALWLFFNKNQNPGFFCKFSFVYAHKCYLALFIAFFRPEDPYIKAPDLFSISEAYIALY